MKPLPIVPASEFKKLRDSDFIPPLTELGHHLAHALVYWQQAETQEERDAWARYLVIVVKAAAR